MIRVTLGGYRAGDPSPAQTSRPFRTERLYDEWIGLVIQKLDELVGFPVDVHANRFNGPGEQVETDGTAEALLRISQALARLWVEWTSVGGPGGDPCPRCRGECAYWPGPCEASP